MLSDADVERAANAAVVLLDANTGQTCISVERVYVEAPVYDDFVAGHREARAAPGRRAGRDGRRRRDDVPAQVDIVERHVEDAVAKGAKVLIGGQRGSRAGHWFEPTVLVDVDHTMEMHARGDVRPDAADHGVADAEEAIRLANDSPYGLAPRSSPATSRAARRSRGASRRARRASTTR